MFSIRILHNAITNKIGGMEIFMMNILRNINRDEFQFDFISDGYEPVFEDEIKSLGCNIYNMPSRVKHPLKFQKEYNKVLRQNNYDIVHIHKNSAAELAAFVACKKAKVKNVIAHSHNTSPMSGKLAIPLHYINRSRLKKLSNIYFSCSELAGRWMFGDNMVDSGNVTFIPNAIDVDKFKYNSEIRNKIRDKLKLNNKFVIGHVGRLHHQKNHKFLIEIFVKIYKKNQNAILMLVGDGDLRQEIEKQVIELGIQNVVFLLGSQKNVNELLQAMDVFLFPSLFEGFPVVAIEAQTAGLPCIVSDKITKEVVLCDGCIRISLQDDIGKWVNAVVQSARNENAHEQIRKAGFDIKNMVENLSKMYRSYIK